MLGHVIKRDGVPHFSDLVSYAIRHLDRLVDRHSNPKLDAFCEMNDIRVFRITYLGSRFQLGIRFERTAGQIAPLGDKEKLWLERYMCAELELEDLEQNSDGGGYLHYTLKEPNERYDLICPGEGCKAYWWDGGAWYAHD